MAMDLLFEVVFHKKKKNALPIECSGHVAKKKSPNGMRKCIRLTVFQRTVLGALVEFKPGAHNNGCIPQHYSLCDIYKVLVLYNPIA